MLADTLVLDPQIVPRKLLCTMSAVRLTISFRLCQPFFEGSKEQQQREFTNSLRGGEWGRV